VRALVISALALTALAGSAAEPAAGVRAFLENRPKADSLASYRIRTGRAAIAAVRLRSELLEQPDNVDLESLLGVAAEANGNYADSFEAFVFGELSEEYDIDAIRAHANVLRALGPPGAAAALRREALWTSGRDRSDVGIYLELVDDYRGDGDLGAAWDAAVTAIAIDPDLAGPYAQLAQVLMDLGRWDEAAAELDVASLLGPDSPYLARATIRSLVQRGSLDAARDLALLATHENRMDLDLMALRADVVTAAGDPETSRWLVEKDRFEGVDHPQMLLATVHALAASGQDTDEIRDRFRRQYDRPVLNSLGLRELPPRP
jgi:tetratricopeptide (TPR) repeat protein